MTQVAETTLGSELEGWTKGVTIGAKFDSLRAAGLAIEDAEFRAMRLSIELPIGERRAELLLMLPNHQLAKKIETVKPTDQSWSTKMSAAVAMAPATLDAILHRMSLPLGLVDALKVGDTIPLLGATVGSVRLFAPDGMLVAEARLGQSGGKRAVRIQPAPEAMMRDARTRSAGSRKSELGLVCNHIDLTAHAAKFVSRRRSRGDDIISGHFACL